MDFIGGHIEIALLLGLYAVVCAYCVGFVSCPFKVHYNVFIQLFYLLCFVLSEFV